MQRVSAVLLLAFAAVAVSARPQRELQQVTVFYDTPAAAGSTSLDVNGNLQLKADGTVKGAAGTSVASSNALANPLLNVLTRGAFDNRPKAASSAYTQIPLALQHTFFPTLSYGLAEAKGDALSTSNGGWANAEFGYNPLSNNLGASVSTGTANSGNTLGSERVGDLGPNRGASGIEFAGYSNDQTTLADARTDQSAQAIAYPNNPLAQPNTLTCTQALLYAVTLTQYDLGAPIAPLPRENPPSIIPFCLTLFNFGTLDDFSNFVNDRNVTGLPVPDGNGTAIAVGSGNDINSTFVDPAGFAEPLPGSNATANATAPGSNGTAPGSNGTDAGSNATAATQPRQAEPLTVSGVISSAVERAPNALQQLAETPLFKALVDRVSNGMFAEAFDGVNELVAKQAARATQNMATPLGNLNAAVGNVTNQVVLGAGNAGMKAAVAAIEAAEPVLAARAAVDKAINPIAKASKATAEKLAAESEKKLQEAMKDMPVEEKQALEAATKKAPQKPEQAQMGRRLSRKHL